MQGQTLESWFPYPDLADAEAVLFCFPHSGGGATAYEGLLSALPRSIAVRPLQPPGRETRLGEPAELDVGDMADVIALEGRPFALYGHSLGALVAYEVARELMRRGESLPQRLFVGACRSPGQAVAQALSLRAMSDVDFFDVVVSTGGAPEQDRLQPLLVDLKVRLPRADLEWMTGRTFEPAPVLPIPVVGIAGLADPVVDPAEMAGWAAVTSAGFTQHTVPGGHLFAQQQVDLLARIVLREWQRD